MNKFMCAGTYVINKLSNKGGKVIAVDKKNGIVIVKSLQNYWSDYTKNLEVISYAGVE